MVVDSGIYRIDLARGRFYVGSAANLRRREGQHRWHVGKGKHHNPTVQRSFDKHGVFEFSVLGLCSVDEVIAREQALLDEHFDDPLCVNMAPTAGNCLGMKHSPGTRAKISAALLGKKRRPFSPEHRANLSAAMLGKNRAPISEETRAKISAAARNRAPTSEETKANMSAARLGMKFSPEHRAKLSAASTARWARKKGLVAA